MVFPGAMLHQVLLLAQVCVQFNRWQFRHTCCFVYGLSTIATILTKAVINNRLIDQFSNTCDFCRLDSCNWLLHVPQHLPKTALPRWQLQQKPYALLA